VMLLLLVVVVVVVEWLRLGCQACWR
jgi:hypothetical protein